MSQISFLLPGQGATPGLPERPTTPLIHETPLARAQRALLAKASIRTAIAAQDDLLGDAGARDRNLRIAGELEREAMRLGASMPPTQAETVDALHRCVSAFTDWDAAEMQAALEHAQRILSRQGAAP